MQIDNLIITAPLSDILCKLKMELATNKGITRFANIRDSGDDIMVCCPYHKDGQEKNPSAGIRKSDGLFHCLACGETHSLVEVINHCFGYDEPFCSFGYKWLAQNFASLEIADREEIEIDIRRNRSNNICSADSINFASGNSRGRISSTSVGANVRFVTEEELDKYRYTHPYLYKRGLTDDIIELFDIGYDADTDSITFPVKDSRGNCLFIARRSIHSKHFNIPKGIDKPLYGLCEIANRYWLSKYEGYVTSMMNVPKIYMCEGLFDCLRFWCNGKPAVAGFGCLYNKLQMEQLKRLPTRCLVDALDSDERGREGAERIRLAIKDKIITSIIYPNGKKDPGELTDEEIQNLEEVFL